MKDLTGRQPKNLLIAGLIILSVGINVFSFDKGQDWGDDFAAYVLQAKAVYSGNYRVLENNIKQNNLTLNFPWGFPMLISPLVRYFDTDIVIIKLYIFLFFLAALGVMFYLFREDKENALLTVLLLASSPYFWEFKNYVLSDIPNLFFMLLVLFVANRSVMNRRPANNEYASRILIGVLVWVSFMVRNQSVILLPVIFLAEVIASRRDPFSRRKALAIFAPAAVFLFFLFLSQAFLPLPTIAYLDHYPASRLPKNAWDNIFYYVAIWKELFRNTIVISRFPGAFTIFFMVFSVAGAFIHAGKNLLFIVFVSLDMMLLLVSPYHQGVRYLIPLAPFLFYFFIIGLKQLRPLAYRIALGVVIFFSMATIFAYSYHSHRVHLAWAGPYQKTSTGLFAYIRDSTEKDATVGFWKPRAMLLYTGRNSALPFSFAECLKKNVGYLAYYLKTGDTGQMPLDSVKSHSPDFREVFRNEDFIIFKLRYDARHYPGASVGVPP